MKNLIGMIFPYIVMLCSGVVFLIFPDQIASIFVLVFSIYLIFTSLKNIIVLNGINRREHLKGIFKISFTKDIVVIILSVLTIFFVMGDNARALSLMVYLIAFSFFITALCDLIDEYKLKKMNLRENIGFDVIVHFILSAIVLLFPHLVGSIFMTLIAILLIVSGAIGLTRIWYIQHSNDGKTDMMA